MQKFLKLSANRILVTQGYSISMDVTKKYPSCMNMK